MCRREVQFIHFFGTDSVLRSVLCFLCEFNFCFEFLSVLERSRARWGTDIKQSRSCISELGRSLLDFGLFCLLLTVPSLIFVVLDVPSLLHNEGSRFTT